MSNKTLWSKMAAEMLAEIKDGKAEAKRINVDGDTEVVFKQKKNKKELAMVRWCRQATPEQRKIARQVFGIPDGVTPAITYSRGWGKVLFSWDEKEIA